MTMEEIKKKLLEIAEKAEPIRQKYPLQEYRSWREGMDDQKIAHIVFVHAASAYARGFAQLLQPEDLSDKDLNYFCAVLSSPDFNEAKLIEETNLVNRMWEFNNIFSKYNREIENLLADEREVHHWSLRDMTGTYRLEINKPTRKFGSRQ